MKKRARFHFDNYYTPSVRTGAYLVLQIGDINGDPGFSYPDHAQVAHEISYIVSGKGTFYLGHEQQEAKTGAIFLNPCGTVHRVESSREDPLRYMYFAFTIKNPDDSPALRILEDFFAHPHTWYMYDAFDVQETFIHLLNEVVINDQFSMMLKESCINQLLCQIYRLMTPKNRSKYLLSAAQRTDTERLVSDMVHYIDANISTMDSLTQLSQEFGYSYTYLAKLFSQRMGETLRNYYMHRRFDRAREYLRQGNSITEVAELLGYQSIHSFSRAFKKQFGQCPSESQKDDQNREIWEALEKIQDDPS